MKKLALLLGSIIISMGTLIAQNADTLYDGSPKNEGLVQNPKFRMGLSFSGVVSWFAPNGGDDFVNPDGARFNIGYGLHTDFGLGTNHNYYFSTGIFALNTGGTLVYNYKNEAGKIAVRTIDYRFNYINIPLTVMLRTNEIGYIVYFARVGIDNGLEFKSIYNSKDLMPDGTVLSKEKEDSPNFGVLYRAGLHIEGGAEFNLTGTTNFFVALEWNNGLTNVFSKDAKAVSSESSDLERIKATSNLIKLNVGVYF